MMQRGRKGRQARLDRFPVADLFFRVVRVFRGHRSSSDPQQSINNALTSLAVSLWVILPFSVHC